MYTHFHLLTLLWLTAFPAMAQRQMEILNRGLVAVKQEDGKVFLSWRLLGTDPKTTAFNLYRTKDGKDERVNPKPLAGTTNFVDLTVGAEYFVRTVDGGKEGPSSAKLKPLDHPYIEFPIKPIDGYRPGDASAADLDGDGQYEIILHQVSKGKDNSFTGITGTPVLDAYKLDGSHLWRIDLGINIREGEHYTQFMAYDLDGDGRAEIACKTADGSKDGTGKIIGDATKDWRNKESDTQRYGRILSGPEFLTIFDGKSGAALRTVNYIPGRDPIGGWGGIGGKDEILYQAMTIDDNGKGLYSTGRLHGDAIHVGDFDIERPGLESYLVTENEEETVRLNTPGAGMHDSRSGKLLWSHSPGVDISDGVVADIDPRHPHGTPVGDPDARSTIPSLHRLAECIL